MVDGVGSVGPRNWRGHWMRSGTKRWMRNVVRRIRSGEIAAAEGSAAQVVARYRDRAGRPLDVRVAAVELINVLRATVANARYVVFGALALHVHPECREALQEGDDAAMERFLHEVRRFHPLSRSSAAGCCGRLSGADTGSRGAIGSWWTFAARTTIPAPGRAGRLPAGAAPGLGRGLLCLRGPGRRGLCCRPPLPRGMDHGRADEGDAGDPRARGPLHRVAAEPGGWPAAGAGAAGKPVHHHARSGANPFFPFPAGRARCWVPGHGRLEWRSGAQDMPFTQKLAGRRAANARRCRSCSRPDRSGRVNGCKGQAQ